MEQIHIGEAIKQKMKEREIRVADFAKAISCTRANAYSIFKRESIDTELLILISDVLEYDFMAEFYHRKRESKKYIVTLEVDENQLRRLPKEYIVHIAEKA